MKPDSLGFELPVEGLAWTDGAGRPAGIFLFQGGLHIAAESSPAARYLAERGALRVATLRFDRDPLESSHPERPVLPVRARDAAHWLRGGPLRN